MAAGTAIPHIYVQGFWDHYLLIGGVGSTLPLALMLLRSKAVHLRTIGRMGVVPGVFNINEPILFGAPIIMNPLFFLPASAGADGQRDPGVLCAEAGSRQPRSIDDAVDNAGAHRRLVGGELEL